MDVRNTVKVYVALKLYVSGVPPAVSRVAAAGVLPVVARPNTFTTRGLVLFAASVVVAGVT